jgi:hypothetical protein
LALFYEALLFRLNNSNRNYIVLTLNIQYVSFIRITQFEFELHSLKTNARIPSSKAGTPFSNAKTLFSNARTSFSNAKTQFSNARTTFSKARAPFSNAKTLFSNARTPFSKSKIVWCLTVRVK